MRGTESAALLLTRLTTPDHGRVNPTALLPGEKRGVGEVLL